MASGAFAGAANPALVPTEGYSVALSAARVTFEAMQYRGLNQGVRASPRPPSDLVNVASGAAGSLAAGRLAFAAGWYVSGLPRFPDFPRGDGDHATHSLIFDGREDVYFAGVSLSAGRLRAGVRLDYTAGRRRMVERTLARANAWRGAYRRDPQPVRTPSTMLDVASAGVGLRTGMLRVDAGAALYRGAPGVRQNHSALVVTLGLAAE
jgi:hypothetical protein